MHLAANASDQTANNTDGEEEEANDGHDAQRSLEEHNDCAEHVGFVDIRSNFSLQLLIVEDDVRSIELIGYVVSSETVDHALHLFWLVWVLVLEDSVNRSVNCVISGGFQDIALSHSDCADNEKRYQNDFSENKKKQVLLANDESRHKATNKSYTNGRK